MNLGLTGGLATAYLPDFIAAVKALGFKVKLDTNGTNPSMMKALVKDGLIDYVAMDIKNAKDKYYLTSGVMNFNLELINESISFLLTAPIDYEFRTTIVKEHHTEQDLLFIGQWITGAKAYFLQSYKDSGDILSPGLSSHNKETLLGYVTLLTPYVEHVFLRGID